ncbi:MAG: hypothetical protein RBU21_24965, partial [FCB group bacterium]|nr:hypothetical protein [FCB group bacterium]
MILLAATPPRAALVTSGERSAANSDGLSLTIAYTATHGLVLDENTEQNPTDLIHLPSGTDVDIECSWSDVPPWWPDGSYLEKAYLTLARWEGDEVQEIGGGQMQASASFVMGSSAGRNDSSPSAVSLRVVWKKLVLAGGDGFPDIFETVELLRTISLNRPRRTVQAKLPGQADDEAVTYNDFDFFLTPWNTPFLDELTTAEDVFNVEYGVTVYCPSPEGPSQATGRAGVLARVIYLDSHYMSEWATTSEDGQTTVTVGSGGLKLAAQGTYFAPAMYIACQPLTADGSVSCPAYFERTLELPALQQFVGTLNVRVTDIDGNPLRAAVDVWGGPYPMNEVPAVGNKTDAAGEAAIKIRPWQPSTVTQDQAIHLAPYVNLAGNITNILDYAQMELVEGRTAYLSPEFGLRGDAYSYGGKGNSSRLARLQYLDENDNVLNEASIQPRILTDAVLANGANRHYWEVEPSRDQKLYKLRVVYDDPEGLSNDPIVASNVEECRVQARWQPRSAGGVSLQFRICAVGAWAGQDNDFYTRLDPGIQALQMATVNELMPVPAAFSRGPAFTPDFSFYQVDIWGIEAVVAGLDAA